MTDEKSTHIVGNSDNRDLGPMLAPGFAIGCVEEVNGSGAKEIPGFVPTRHELLQLVKYWTEEYLQPDWFSFCTGNTGSTEMRISAFAIRRIDRIASLLGNEDVDTAITEVYNRFRERQYQVLWQVFRHGDEAQRQKIVEEFDTATQEGGPMPTGGWFAQPHMRLTSPSFEEGEYIADKFSTGGGNTSPPLAWSQPPSGTRSLAITMDDLEPEEGPRNHWLIFDLQPDSVVLDEAIPPREQLASGARQGKNSFYKIGYYGPHKTQPFRRYQFRVYALDRLLGLDAGISKKELLDAMEDHILDEGHLTVAYGCKS